MKIIFLTFLLFCSVFLSAQDPHFSMPYSTSIVVNPAIAGTSGLSRIQSNYRNQWPNISGSYVTTLLSYDQYVKAVSGGAGVSYLRDVSEQGAIKQNRIDFTYSYSGPFSGAPDRFQICFGFDAAYVQRSVDWTKITFGTPGIPLGGNKEIISYPDFSCGIFGYSKKFFGGFAVWHLTEPEEGFISGSPLPMKYVANCGLNTGSPDSVKGFSLTPSILYLQQHDFRSFIIQCAVNYSNCAIGLGYRNGDAIIASLGFRTNLFRMAYSYDMTISELGITSGGAHEISISFIFNRMYKPTEVLSFSTAAF